MSDTSISSCPNSVNPVPAGTRLGHACEAGAGRAGPAGLSVCALQEGLEGYQRPESEPPCVRAERVPPASNTGVDCTGAILDWLHGTFLDCSIPDGLAHVRLLFGSIEHLDQGFRGYSSSGKILGGLGRVGWDYKRPDMGVHVMLPGSALGELGREVKDMRGFGQALLDMGFKAGRIDVALDDKKGVLDFDLMEKAMRAREYTSRWKGWNMIENSEGGKTAEFGSRCSAAFLRIYDKANEQGVSGHWLRCEIELKRERAEKAFEKWVKGGSLAFIPGLIRYYLEFKEPEQDTNKRRWSVVGWWKKFLLEAEKAGLCLPSPVRSIEKILLWLEHQVGPSLALVAMSQGGSVDFIYDLLRSGGSRLKSDQLKLLEGAGCA